MSGHQFTGDWQRRMLNFDKPHRYNGDCGGFGIGYDTPASVGVALANKKLGRLSVGIVGDGDLNFVGPACCGRRRTTRSRCCWSCTTTAPTTRR